MLNALFHWKFAKRVEKLVLRCSCLEEVCIKYYTCKASVGNRKQSKPTLQTGNQNAHENPGCGVGPRILSMAIVHIWNSQYYNFLFLSFFFFSFLLSFFFFSFLQGDTTQCSRQLQKYTGTSVQILDLDCYL